MILLLSLLFAVLDVPLPVESHHPVPSGKILFSKRIDGHSSEIWIANLDGTEEKKVTEEGYAVTPAVGQVKEPLPSFFFVSYASGQPKIYFWKSEREKPKAVLSLRGNQILPAFCPKTGALAFISDAAGRPDLFLQQFDSAGKAKGRPKQLFSAPRSTEASPTFSPDGKLIAFVSDKEGTPRIYLMSLEGNQEVRRLTVRNRENTSPAFSPNGRQIAYSAKVDGVRQIWLYDMETGEERGLTAGVENKENPTWAGAHHLVYNTETKGISSLYLLAIDTQVEQLIPLSAGQNRFPCFTSHPRQEIGIQL